MRFFALIILASLPTSLFSAQTKKAQNQQADLAPSRNVLNKQQWQQVDASVERALKWLADGQNKDGSFETYRSGQPAVTSLCLMAFMAQGHNVGEGEYGDVLQRAVDYIAAKQQRNGIIARLRSPGPPISRRVPITVGVAIAYNHALSALALAEVYGQGDEKQTKDLKPIIERAIAATLTMQNWQEQTPQKGGWRYLTRTESSHSDLSVTGWQLMFLRSARTGGFDVPAESINKAVGYIESCFDKKHGTFSYLAGSDQHLTRGMAGAGILALAHVGKHDSPMATRTGDWILKNNFDVYNGIDRWHPLQDHADRYHYGLLTCCQAMYQLGGRYWKEFYPSTVESILANQLPDGSWPAESVQSDSQFGTRYTTALCVLSLGAPNQLLPIFQR